MRQAIRQQNRRQNPRTPQPARAGGRVGKQPLDNSGVSDGEAKGLSVLLVEDSPGDADLCQVYLKEGFGPQVNVVHVTQVQQAEAALQEHSVDVVLLDLGLPDAMGMESVVRLRSSTAEVPIVVLTGNRDTQLGVQAIREHAQDFCAKQDLNAGVLSQSIRHAIERHRLQVQYYRFLETMPESVVVIDEDQRVLFVNQAGCKILDLDIRTWFGQPLPAALADTGLDEMVLPNGRVMELRSVAVEWYAAPATLLVYHDVTERKQAESQLRELVQYDQLTGLSNRGYFFDHVNRLIGNLNREGGMMAMLFIDLNRFKFVNDTMGHGVGDELLRHVGKRLSETSRRGDFLARLGGDEFALVLPSIRRPDEAARVAEKLIQSFEQPIAVHGSNIDVGLSIGIAIYPHCGEGVEALYSAADTAMYRAKKQGHNAYQFFSNNLQEEIETWIRHEQAVRQVVADSALWLAYQPQVRAVDGAPTIVEALLRWPRDSVSVLPPTAFVPIIEDLGLIGHVGRWVMHTASATVLGMERLTGIPVRVAINVSMRQLYDGRIYQEIAEILDSTGLPEDRLEVELTESSIMGDPARAQQTLEAIRGLGVSVAIDDFGTGYSSLSYLRCLPVDVLKVDQSFVEGIGRNAQTEAILRSLFDLAQALGLKVVAEGVETSEQQAFLVDAGCDYLQGYHICEPVTEQQMIDWLRRKGT